MNRYLSLLGLEPGADSGAVRQALTQEIARWSRRLGAATTPKMRFEAEERLAQLNEARKGLSEAALEIHAIIDETTVTRAATPLPDVIACPYCCEPIRAAARKCRWCNEWLEPKERPVQVQQTIVPTAASSAAQGEGMALPGLLHAFQGELRTGALLLQEVASFETGHLVPAHLMPGPDANSIYVCDAMSGCLQVRDVSGALVRTLDLTPTMTRLKTHGIAVDSTGYLYVYDQVKRSLHSFLTDGDAGAPRFRSFYLAQPDFLSSGDACQPLVFDSGSRMFYQLDPELAMHTLGSLPAHFPGAMRALHVNRDRSLHLLIGNAEGYRVTHLGPDLTTREAWHLDRRVVDPVALAVTAGGRVFVACGARSEIHAFERDGEHLFSFGRTMKGAPGTEAYTSLLTTRSGHLLISNRIARKVHVLRISES